MRRFWAGAAGAVSVLALAACSSGGGSSEDSRPPTTLKGANYTVPGGNLPQAQLRRTEGGSGANINDVVYLDDGVFEFLGRRSAQLDAITTEFTDDNGATAVVTAPPGYEDSRLIRMQFADGGVSYVSEGVLGRFTTEARMATATGSATYIGNGTAQVRGDRGFGNTFDLSGGNARVDVNFGSRTVNTTLDFRGTAGSVSAPVDVLQINGQAISGNRFGGGTLASSKGGVVVPAYTTSNVAASGVFAGWNDATGNVRGGNLPAEVGGSFVATPGVATVTGRYLAD
ncbi:MAG: transferrin-binding protein-like solute binding protein [Rhodobacteraceae bacterium]|jgi:hypothetical protein|nr:transferrin-binding protein-like solute binding protein [Paracoccaceae bacterium]